jgi:hypothetical protein
VPSGAFGDRGRELEREACLARATWTRERHQPRPLQQPRVSASSRSGR